VVFSAEDKMRGGAKSQVDQYKEQVSAKYTDEIVTELVSTPPSLPGSSSLHFLVAPTFFFHSGQQSHR